MEKEDDDVVHDQGDTSVSDKDKKDKKNKKKEKEEKKLEKEKKKKEEKEQKKIATMRKKSLPVPVKKAIHSDIYALLSHISGSVTSNA
jgi:outer membrane biosynthesis protein TonB